MNARSFSIALLLGLGLVLAGPGQAQSEAAFNARVDAMTRSGGTTEAPLTAAWNSLDALVLARLNGGTAPSRVGAMLASLRGYEPAERAGIAFRDVPRSVPSYAATAVRVGADTVVLGAYSLGTRGPGRVSVFARRAGRWRQVGKVAARDPAAAFVVRGSGAPAVVTVDVFTGGDRSEGRVRSWALSTAGLRLLAAEREPLLDPEVAASDSTLRLRFTRFPRGLRTSVIGTRLGYMATYRAVAGRVAPDTTPLTPWVETVDRFYAEQSARRRYVASDSIQRLLTATPPDVVEDGGRLDDGTGYVVLDPERPTRVEVRRDTNGRWIVTGVARTGR